MNLEEAIVTLQPIISKEYIKILKKYIDFVAKEKMKTFKGIDVNTRNVTGYTLGNEKISDIIYFKLINQILLQSYPLYKFKFPHLFTNVINQVDLLKYEKGGKYEIHTDHGNDSPRTLTCILNLNEDYEGGDFVFYKQNSKEELKRIKCKTGTLIFFPSNFLYPHKVEPITKGKRYSIVAWLI